MFILSWCLGLDWDVLDPAHLLCPPTYNPEFLSSVEVDQGTQQGGVTVRFQGKAWRRPTAGRNDARRAPGSAQHQKVLAAEEQVGVK